MVYNTDMEQAALSLMAAAPKKRVIPFPYQGKNYYIKRCISNGRNRFAKTSPRTAYLTEIYKTLLVNERLSLAPDIVFLGPDYFVMAASGRPLQRIVREYPEDASEAYYKAGESLARLHAAGLHHGRPALRDIVWQHEKRTITILDWESEKHFFFKDMRLLDLFLFIHSYFRENWPSEGLLDTAMSGYCSIPGFQDRLQALSAFIGRHALLFSLCRRCSSFGWVDVVAVSKTEAYIRKLLARYC